MTELFTEDEVLQMLQEAVVDAGGVAAFAQQAGVSNQYVSAVLTARKQGPGPAILKALGMRRQVMYAPVEPVGVRA